MKTLKYIIWTLLATAVLAGCSDDPTYTPGPQDDPDNYGVYFPEQTVSTTVERDPAEEPTVTFKVCRSRYLDAITVPVEITASEEGILEITPITFGPGEKETEFTVSFPKAVEGTEYKCDMRIVDPRYVSMYGPESTEFSFSVIRASWELVTGPEGQTKGRWRDDILGNMYSNNAAGFNKNPEVEIEIYQRRDIPGYYRMKVYGQELVYALSGGPIRFTGRDLYTIVDARNHDKVFIPYQSTGLTLLEANGEVKIASNTSDNFVMEESANEYGTLQNGIITFPAGSILMELEKETGKFFTVNREGLLRIMLPGATAPDFTVTLKKNEPVDGVVEVNTEFAADVSIMKFSIFEGVLDAGQASLTAQDLDASKRFDGQIDQSGTIRIENKATGKYTLVGCIYDEEGIMRDYAFISFGYVAQDDEKPVILTMGLELTNEYAGQGISTDNALKFYAFGEEIESVTYGLFRTDRIGNTDLDALLDARGTAFTAEEIKQLNGGHFSRMLTGLVSDREFSLVLRAYNGYVSKTMVVSNRTTGTYNPAMDTFEYEDFLPVGEQPTVEELMNTSWNYYAYNFMDEKSVRRKIGQVTMTKSETGTDYAPVLDIKGLSGIEFDSEGTIFGHYMPSVPAYSNFRGALEMDIVQGATTGIYQGQDVLIGFMAENDEGVYSGPGMMMGAVADGYLYCVPSPRAIELGFVFRFFYTATSSQLLSLMAEMMLVDPAKDQGEISIEAQKRIVALRKRALAGLWPSNYVEQHQFSGATGYVPPVSVRIPDNLVFETLPASAPRVKRAQTTISVVPERRTEQATATTELIRKGVSATDKVRR